MYNNIVNDGYISEIYAMAIMLFIMMTMIVIMTLIMMTKI